jgi:hypothetical protein
VCSICNIVVSYLDSAPLGAIGFELENDSCVTNRTFVKGRAFGVKVKVYIFELVYIFV